MTPPHRSGALSVSVWLGAVLAGASLALVAIAALAPSIVASVGLDASAIGVFSGLVWVCALLASPIGGALVERLGPWAVSRACVALSALGVLAVATGQPVLFWAGAVLIGLAQGIETPPSSLLLAHHVPVPRRPLYFSLKQTGVQVGAVGASLLLPTLALAWGWQAALVAVAVLLALLAALLGRAARAHPLPAPAGEPRAAGLSAALRDGLLQWLPRLRARAGLTRLSFAAAAFGATQVCMNTFIVSWGVQERGLALTGAGLLAAAAQGAGLLARPLWGWVASRATGPRAVLVGLGVTMTACSGLLGTFGTQLPAAPLALLLAVFGLSASGWNGVFLAEIAARSDPQRIAPTSAAATVPLFIGLVLGPLAFAAIAAASGLSAGFVAMSGVALAGTLLLPRDGSGASTTRTGG